ncbi:L-cysteine desulfidase family protein [Dysosmobacter sp. HCP28S3_G4]|uniref:L-cysteine desulfidase family protein n=1 Tax=Dysosmobacter sp. HCP28S3_G4 TaxID=3438938 RepID=UPI003F8B3830
MERNSEIYKAYLEILNKELVPAMGCTEPIAVAYCAAKARETLGCLPDRVELEVSGNIIKNVKSVVVPNTGGMRGMAVAAAIGIVAGDADKELEVVSQVTPEQIRQLKDYMQQAEITMKQADSDLLLDIGVRVSKGGDWAKVRIINHHTGIALIEKNGEVLFRAKPEDPAQEAGVDYDLLTVEQIYDFAQSLDIEDVRELFDRQLRCNSAISQEGLRGDYGANVGRTILKTQPDNVRTRARAKAAAGSDARMNGCELPVVINSGSGNQGITVSLPVLEYAQELGATEEQLYRALAISNLTAVHLKSGIGRLSAYCGAISAGVSAGAAICYLQGGDLRSVSHTIVNALAISSGIICDGAKASCAAKISVAVDAGIFGYEMFQNGQQFYSGDGIVTKGVENTIRNVAVLGKEGMYETDKTILSIMTRC